MALPSGSGIGPVMSAGCPRCPGATRRAATLRPAPRACL